MTDTPMLTLFHIYKAYGDVPVIADLSCTLAAGEVVSLVGVSGCGKSTLLRLIAGLEVPDRGGVTRDFARVGIVFQQPRLLPWRTAHENVALALTSPDADAIAQRALAQVGLHDYGGYLPAQLSGGMQQRAAIARALAVDPDLLLLDEPFASLDLPRRLRLIDLLRGLLSKRRRAAVYVTHDVREALLLSDRICVLSPRPARVMRVFVQQGAREQSGHRLTPHQQEIEAQVLRLLMDNPA